MTGDELRPRTTKRARRGLFAAAFLLVLVLVCSIVFRHLSDVTVIPVTSAQIDAILGGDLRWHPSPHGQTLDLASLDRLGKDPLAVKVVRQVSESSSYDPLAHSADIEASHRVTDELDKLIAGKVLKVEQTHFSSFTTSSTQRVLAKLCAAQIQLEIRRKNAPRAYAACSTALRFVDFLQRSPVGDEVDLLVRMAGSDILLDSVDRAVRSGLFNAAQLRELYGDIKPAPESDERLADALRADFQEELVPAIREIAKEGGVDALFVTIGRDDSDSTGLAAGELDLPATIRRAAAFERVGIANCARAWVQRDQSVTQDLKILQDTIPSPPQILLSDSWVKRVWAKCEFKARMHSIANSIGILALIQLETGDREALVGSFRSRTGVEAHRLTILMQMYKELHGNALPKSLGDLQGLASGVFPRDIFLGGPFHYSHERAIFWSIGQNGLDDGGRGGAVRYMSPDIVWSVR